MLVSEDGVHFDNFNGKKVIIPPMTDAGIGDRTHTRDPKVWKGKDAWYMVIGSRTEENNGKLLFYKSENLSDWTYVNDVSKENAFGWMWECPDYFETEGGKVLVFSPMGLLENGTDEPNQVICTMVAFEEETCSMHIPDSYQFLDYGLELYASQSTLDAEGRRVLTAWLRMPEAVDGKWIGMYCIPRVVEVKNGHIYFRVHPNVESVFTKKINSPAEADEDGYRVSLDIEDGETVNIGGYKIFRNGNRICTDRTAVFQKHTAHRMKFETPEIKEGYRMDIYVDKNLIEVYVNNGEYVISNCVYDLKKEIQADCLEKLKIYTLE